ncbi:MAG: prephenate/arogenate dehydrogenase [Synechococcus sp. SB0665_bin_28]|nr:prephenate/arogenate dehydrogenase [Synechococcus sp. SB0665_bin_28]MYF20626.1 prephenate/arogenate dehydrogenase [Synechococcus sp. SB0677_bin_5]
MSCPGSRLHTLRSCLAGRPVGLVGLGLIGGSIGLDLKDRGVPTVALAHRARTAERARQRGLADVVSTDPAVLGEAGLVVLCLPLDRLLVPTPQLLSALPRQALISDVGSVKGPVLAAWQAAWSGRFIGGHPMAGTTAAGVDAGRAGLFQGRPWALTMTETAASADLQLLEALISVLGARVIHCTAQDHDHAVALVSHLPVLVSAALLHAMAREQNQPIRHLAESLASSGFADTTRVGGGNPRLGTLMASHNRQALQQALGHYRESLDTLEGLVREERWDQLCAALERTQALRQQIVGP